MIGRTFGNWHVISRSVNYTRNDKHIYWLCECRRCGSIRAVRSATLRAGVTESCGCRRFDLGKLNRLHGLSHTAGYRVWASMIDRCQNERNKDYKYYGGRGIKVCDRWQDVSQFIADMGQPPKGLTIDRREVNGNYEPNNCRWAPRDVQLKNRRVAQHPSTM